MSSQANSLTSVLFALGANFAIFIAKLFAALYTGSGAMLAEAIHSLADTGNQLLLIVGLKSSKRPPTLDHPLGYGKNIYFWSFIVALVLFSLGGMFSIYEGIHKLKYPEALNSPWIAIGVLLFSIVAESISLWGCLREVNKVRDGRSLFTWFRQSRESALLVVLGEDIAALFGLLFAFLAISLTMITGDPLYDALGTMVIGGLLIVIAVMIGIEVKGLLLGQGVETKTHAAMVSFLESQDEIKQVYNLITLQLGQDVMAAIKVEMNEFSDQNSMIKAINNCEVRFKKQFPQVMWSFFEPDIRN